MANTVIFHDMDPGIAVTLTEVGPGVPGLAQGFHGVCTECGRIAHHWKRDAAITAAQQHVDRHESSL